MDNNQQLHNEVLHGDPFFQIIIKYLTTIDLYYLSNTCTYYNEIFTKKKLNDHALISVNHMFSELFGEHVIAFKNLVKNTNSIVTGLVIRDAIRKDYMSKKYNITLYTSDNNSEIIKSNHIKSLLKSLNNKRVKIEIATVIADNDIEDVVLNFNRDSYYSIYENIYYYKGNRETVELNSDILTNETYCDEDNIELQLTKIGPLINRRMNIVGLNCSKEDYDFYYNEDSNGNVLYIPKYQFTNLFDNDSFDDISDDEAKKDIEKKLLNKLRTAKLKELKCIYGNKCPYIKIYNKVNKKNNIQKTEWHVHIDDDILHFRKDNIKNQILESYQLFESIGDYDFLSILTVCMVSVVCYMLYIMVLL